MMRGRKPRRLSIRPQDFPVLRWIAWASRLPAFQVRRARMVLAIAGGQRMHQLAASLECNEATIWRNCRRYEARGLSGLLADDRMTVTSRLASQCRASAG